MRDKRSINALDVAWRHIDGLATNEELAVARNDAYAAYAAAYAADAAYAAYAAAYGAYAAYAAYAAADAVGVGARGMSREAQKDKLLQILEAGQWVD